MFRAMQAKPAPPESIAISTPDVTRMVARWIQRRKPAAAARFGEGEGRVLAADWNDPLSVRVAARKVRRQTGHLPHPESVFKLQALLLDAFDRADIAGIEADERFSDEHREWAAYVCNLYAQRAHERAGHTYSTHCLFNSALREALPELLSGLERVSIVTSRNLEPVFRERYGVPDVRVFQIPSQHIMRAVDDEFESAMHDVPMWPDAYMRISEALTVREQGEVFLIGAGLFAKSLCVQVKDAGGIGIDMGSSLDGIAGKVTRGRRAPREQPPA